MTTYYLQREVVWVLVGDVWEEKEGRWMIDRALHAGFIEHDSVEALSWVEAKDKFGFPLTAKQVAMLERK